MGDRKIEVGDVFTWQVSRRQFLGLSAAAASALALGAMPLGPAQPAPSRRTHVPPVKFDREVYTLCEQCVWRCGLRAKVLDGKVYKLDGNPNHPHSNGMLCPRGQAGIAAANL